MITESHRKKVKTTDGKYSLIESLLDKTRLKIAFILYNDGGDFTAEEIAKAIDAPVIQINGHLLVLEKNGLIEKDNKNPCRYKQSKILNNICKYLFSD